MEVTFFFTGLLLCLPELPSSFSSFTSLERFLLWVNLDGLWVFISVLSTSNPSNTLPSDISPPKTEAHFTPSWEDFCLLVWLIGCPLLLLRFLSSLVTPSLWSSAEVLEILLSPACTFSGRPTSLVVSSVPSSPSRSEKVLFGMWPREETLTFGEGSLVVADAFFGGSCTFCWLLSSAADNLLLIPSFGVLVFEGVCSGVVCLNSFASTLSFSSKGKFFFGTWPLDEDLTLVKLESTVSLSATEEPDIIDFTSTFSSSSSKEKTLFGTGVLEEDLTLGEASSGVSFLTFVFEGPLSFGVIMTPGFLGVTFPSDFLFEAIFFVIFPTLLCPARPVSWICSFVCLLETADSVSSSFRKSW